LKVLIDTNILLWAAGVEKRLPKKAKSIFADPDALLYLSTASSWEIAIKWSKGRLLLPYKPILFIEDICRRADITLLDINLDDSCAVADLPQSDHKDPFDRLLVAQAQNRGMKLMTADAKLKQYKADLILL
jgi:PIN domain nuclease of toxin-antitoxin system